MSKKYLCELLLNFLLTRWLHPEFGCCGQRTFIVSASQNRNRSIRKNFSLTRKVDFQSFFPKKISFKYMKTTFKINILVQQQYIKQISISLSTCMNERENERLLNCSCMSQWARFGTSKIFMVPIVQVPHEMQKIFFKIFFASHEVPKLLRQ